MTNDIERKPLISIITINYNSLEATLGFLKSLVLLKYRNFEVIIVDNASERFEEYSILEIIPEAKIIRSPKNLGFAGGNNLGSTIANGEFYAFLNNDLVLDKDFFYPILQVFESYPDVGIVTPKFLYYDTEVIQYAGAESLSKWFGTGKKYGDMELDRGQYDFIKEVGIVHGAAMVIKNNVFETVGPMPDVYFLYYEELEWGELIKQKGYKLFYCGYSKVYDKVSQSIGAQNPLKTYYLSRNRLLYARRNTKGLQKLFWISYMILLSFPSQIIRYFLQGELKYAGAIMKGVSWNLFNNRQLKFVI